MLIRPHIGNGPSDHLFENRLQCSSFTISPPISNVIAASKFPTPPPTGIYVEHSAGLCRKHFARWLSHLRFLQMIRARPPQRTDRNLPTATEMRGISTIFICTMRIIVGSHRIPRFRTQVSKHVAVATTMKRFPTVGISTPSTPILMLAAKENLGSGPTLEREHNCHFPTGIGITRSTQEKLESTSGTC